jgi:electron transport complex protein RnfC
MVIMGGPLMGFTLPSLNVPVVKISNCLLAPSQSELGEPEPEEACIRCSLCAESCPAGLLPQQLYWFSKGEEHEKARKHNLFDCIECGACAYVCPSNIPLVQYYRQEKAEIRAIDSETARATEAKARFEAKQARMEREKLAREEKHQKAAVKLGDAPAEEAPITETVAEQPAEADPRKAALAAAIARAKAKKAAAEQEIPVASEPVPETPPSAEDDRKAAVAAAIARVKAKKAGNNGVVVEAKESELAVAPQAPAEDDRKAAVAAAIARVKAKKAAAAQPVNAEENVTTSPYEPSADDKRKAAVAAAIARAKAKKAAALSEAQDAEPEKKEISQQESDPRKAAVAAAIARVKARKAAQTMSNEE